MERDREGCLEGISFGYVLCFYCLTTSVFIIFCLSLLRVLHYHTINTMKSPILQHPNASKSASIRLHEACDLIFCIFDDSHSFGHFQIVVLYVDCVIASVYVENECPFKPNNKMKKKKAIRSLSRL